MSKKMPTLQELNIGRTYEVQNGFCWIAEDLRETVEYANKYLKENPTHSIDLGDGLGHRCGKNFKVPSGWNTKYLFNVPKTSKVESVEKVTKKKVRKAAGKRGSNLDLSGMTYEEKAKKVKSLISEHFSDGIPDCVKFKKVIIKSGPSEACPDGIRLSIKIVGLDNQLYKDMDGMFRIASCISRIKEFA